MAAGEKKLHSNLESLKEHCTGKSSNMICRRPCFLFLLGIVLAGLMLSSCYSLKGYSIDPKEYHTYFVGQFKNSAYSSPATINQKFGEALKDKVSSESSLDYTEENPDIEFQGAIQNFIVSAVAPQPNEQTAFNRLTISINVEYTNHKDPKDHWTKTFSHFADFATDQDLIQVQDELIDIIFKQILEDIFNQAFNNW